jgi:hypothetical protein
LEPMGSIGRQSPSHRSRALAPVSSSPEGGTCVEQALGFRL